MWGLERDTKKKYFQIYQELMFLWNFISFGLSKYKPIIDWTLFTSSFLFFTLVASLCRFSFLKANSIGCCSNSSSFFCLQGVVIREVVNGTSCETCNNLCPGFKPHAWRWVELFVHFSFFSWFYWGCVANIQLKTSVFSIDFELGPILGSLLLTFANRLSFL